MPNQNFTNLKVGDTLFIRDGRFIEICTFSRFTKTLLIVQLKTDNLRIGYYERRFYKDGGGEQGDRHCSISVPTEADIQLFQDEIAHRALVKKVTATDWSKLTLATLQGIERIAECKGNKI